MADDSDGADVTRGKLLERYGRPERLRGTGDVLRMLGMRDAVHPRDAFVFLYGSVEAAEAFGRLNEDRYGNGRLGVVAVPAGAIGGIDLRPQLTAHGVEPTDPALPDDWKPEVPRG